MSPNIEGDGRTGKSMLAGAILSRCRRTGRGGGKPSPVWSTGRYENLYPTVQWGSSRHLSRCLLAWAANARHPPDCLRRVSHRLQKTVLVATLPYVVGDVLVLVQGDQQAASEERRLWRRQRPAHKHAVYGTASRAGAGTLVGVAAHVGSGSLPLPAMDFRAGRWLRACSAEPAPACNGLSPPPTCSLPRWARGPRCRLA